ncbi:hypothetical protein P7K49_039085 [Saguinus oedipus]|uniref:PICALM interacting mitotic regulator n=1 Tax=Saguinus oedipus TaxID=9490 RepID=A0ABQ9TGJ3_SAGOE|nr:hypothetical protein P7K49_039085 [Saguinus oedipus]
MRTSVRRRSLRHQEQLEDSKELQPVASHQETSSGALGSLCREFQRRLPLKAVNLNLRPGPSWKRLETPEPGQQGLQAAARSAKSALGTMSQRIQESCQSGTKWLVETQSDSDLEPVGAGIQHLQKLSQELDEAIMAEERKQVLSDRQGFTPKDICASPCASWGKSTGVISNPGPLLMRT